MYDVHVHGSTVFQIIFEKVYILYNCSSIIVLSITCIHIDEIIKVIISSEVCELSFCHALSMAFEI